MSDGEYNPLDYQNLTRHCVDELMRRGPYALPLQAEFAGAGVYALFYAGEHDIYHKILSPGATWPMYVGKAVPSGARKGAKGVVGGTRPLHARISEHVNSIQSARDLRISDFQCRYLVVTPLWITMAERFLIEFYQPVWNVCIDGFGNHDPGKGRYEGEITWWDALHPGRSWAAKLQAGKTANEARIKLTKFLATYVPNRRSDASNIAVDPDSDD